MQFIGITLSLLGLIIFIAPQTLGYIVGAILILIGGNILLMSLAFKKGTKDSIRFGGYEIFRNKK